MGRIKSALAGVAVASAVVSIAAQTPTAEQKVSFEVVSIKPDVGIVPGAPHEFFACHGTDDSSKDWAGMPLLTDSLRVVPMGRCLGIRTSLGMLLDDAYGVGRGKKLGGPSWIESDRFAIEAKAEGSATAAQLQEMVRTLLRDRFKLQFHYETQQADGFVLSVAKDGPKLQAATGNEENAGMHYGPPPEPGQNVIKAVNVPFPDFFKQLSEFLLPSVLPGKRVIDDTHIVGSYNITLGPFLERQDDPRFSGRTIFEAFQALGLHLEPQRISVDVLVIDHVEKPTMN